MKLVLVVLLAHATLGSRPPLKEALGENLNRCRSQPCRLPQERVVNAYTELMQRGEVFSRHSVLPRRILLHRCDRSGCCLDASKPCCVPKASANVSLPFSVVDLLSNHEETGRVFVFENHTACECRRER